MTAGFVSNGGAPVGPTDTWNTTHRSGRGRDILTWEQANQLALVATARAHAALGVDLGQPRVDVAAAIGRADLELLWRPMPRIFGLYFNEPNSNIGILVNSGLHSGARRHTAAHELGHHWLEHTTSVDDGSTIDLGSEDAAGVAIDYLPATRPRRWTDQEKTAEAFAVWFLMPRRVVQNALSLLGVDRPQSALDVYRLSTILGTSYATTLRHLPNLRVATARDTKAWARVAPGRLKARLDRGATSPINRRHDVVVLDPNGANPAGPTWDEVHVESGDRIVLPGVGPAEVDAPAWVTAVGVTRDAELTDGVVLEIDALDEPAIGGLSMPGHWSTQILAGPQPAGRQPKTLP